MPGFTTGPSGCQTTGGSLEDRSKQAVRLNKFSKLIAKHMTFRSFNRSMASNWKGFPSFLSKGGSICGEAARRIK